MSRAAFHAKRRAALLAYRGVVGGIEWVSRSLGRFLPMCELQLEQCLRALLDAAGVCMCFAPSSSDCRAKKASPRG